MALMSWSDNLSVNIKEIDEQHKKLVGMVNDLHDAMKMGKGNDVTGKILTGLIQYVGTHFATEERLMKTHNYPDFVKHKAEHDNLTKKAIELQKQHQEGKSVLTIELMSFLKDWLSNHIMGRDKAYSPFFNGKGIS
ncbi:MAG: bacteriohemerythrin [Nitrospiraceae bacterium]|nr:bacteriohemerythrin [Nitrospirota bacterium]MDA8214271.1 bacteriohemerythrin [Nitrospiraceae bacterium]MDA8338295.1 bacteriohemerythrin [Nitrospiraceae bacterium]